MRRCPATVFLAAVVVGAGPAHAAEVAVASGDTAARVRASDGRLALVSLRSRQTGREWAARDAAGADIPLVAFVEQDGRRRAVAWKLAEVRRSSNRGARRATFVFTCGAPRMELRSTWQAASGPGPVEHTLSITNRSGAALLLPLQTSLRFACRAPAGHALERWWVEKGAGAPTDVGTHREPLSPGYDRALLSTPYAEDGAPHDAIPWTAVQDAGARQGWYAGIEFSGRVRLRLTAPAGQPSPPLLADFGLTPEADESRSTPEYRTRLAPGETFDAPTVFVGCYAGDVDDGANRLHRWVATALRPPSPDPRYPLLTLNSWGSGMAVDDALARRMADDAAALGIEMLHIDAGWFRAVGDWRPNPAKFPHGLAAIADYAHARGLKFGLWVGWTQGGVQPDAPDRQRILNVFAPDRRDWFARDLPPTWKPADFTGADLCLSDPAADAWCLSLLDRLVADYHLDMLEHDQRMIVDACVRRDHPHTGARTDVAYRAARGYYAVYDALRARHPRLLFEDCVNGGRTVDYGIARRVHYVSITDTYSPLANRRAFYDASYALPPAMCECYVQNEPVKTAAAFRTMLRSGMMGWCTIMCDTTRWTPSQHAIARRQFALYKAWLRPLIARGNLYHLTARPDGRRWDAVQYADPTGHRAALLAFRGTTDEPRHLFRLRGLDPTARYTVTVEDGGQPPVVRTGRALMRDGLTVALSEPGASQVVLLKRR